MTNEKLLQKREKFLTQIEDLKAECEKSVERLEIYIDVIDDLLTEQDESAMETEAKQTEENE